MAHLIDNSKGFNAFVSFAAPAWHGLGTVLNNPLNTADALQQGGLNYDVLKLPNVHCLPDGQELISEDSFFTVRTDVNKVLGSRLGKDYEVMQNIDALNIVDEILQSGTATIETAGAINEGKKVFICLKVVKDITVGSEDTVKQYILIANSHDGSLAITAMPTNVRVVCNNTLTAALRGSQDKIKIRHTINAASRMNEAMKVLKLIANNTAVNQDNYNEMALQVISKEQMFNYFGNVFCTPAEIKELQSGTKTAYFNYLVNGISLTTKDANNCSHSGQCDNDVLATMKKPYVKKQLDALPIDKLAMELKEYGAWDEIELKDHNANLMRIVWIAAGDITEGK